MRCRAKRIYLTISALSNSVFSEALTVGGSFSRELYLSKATITVFLRQRIAGHAKLALRYSLKIPVESV